MNKKLLLSTTRKRSVLLLIAAATGVAVLVAIGAALWMDVSESSSIQNATITDLNNDSSNGTTVSILSSPLPNTTTEPVPSTSTSTSTSTMTMTTEATTEATTLSVGMGFEGRKLPECHSSFCEIERVNTEAVHPLLRSIVQTPFFSHFKIDLCSSCELWDDAPLCRMKDCSVCECDDPPSWSFENVPDLPPTGPDSRTGTDDYETISTTTAHHSQQGFNRWNRTGIGSEAITDTRFESLLFGTERELDKSPHDSNTARVVNLLQNPEGFTGYTDPSAEKIWSTVHSQNCFQPHYYLDTRSSKEPEPAGEGGHSNKAPNDTQTGNEEKQPNALYNHCSLPCEQRLYNRLISGMHSSISLHIAHSYCLELDPDRVGECSLWGSNDQLARDRVLSHPDRVENLYVAFSLLLTAVVRAGGAIGAAVPVTGGFDVDVDADFDADVDANAFSWEEANCRQLWNERLLPELLALSDRVPKSIAHDLSRMLGDNETETETGVDADADADADTQTQTQTQPTKRSELQRRFEELQSIVQCVGCDRCKLWGTLQTLGIGTALKILCEEDSGSSSSSSSSSTFLSRQEAVALVNTLERFSSALIYAREFESRMRRGEHRTESVSPL